VPCAEISARLGIPVGSIGPSRRQSLNKLRRHPAIAALINAESRHRSTSSPTLGASAIRSEATRIVETSAADQTACVVHSPLSETRLRRARPIGRLTLAVNTGDVNCSLDLQTQG